MLRRPVESAQFRAIRWTERLAENDAGPSIGSIADSYDNDLAETFNGLYKSELIYPKGPWRGLDDVEFATPQYAHWFNHRRLHGAIEPGPGLHDPAAFEADHYRQAISADQA